ncbi:PD-(D/E)XK nuclease domain-containing protein [uncultured Streptococcus sp.]|uniref:PD-(D/E)XK nuclease domain-containing protein n=1 Tax=uncultured Streptococcus sp. TaxID=83427 RepID=UPI0025955E73|nr:PD-(D/E)XK nuclease domain-containing protein [uncultured Streptococcus sp.]
MQIKRLEIELSEYVNEWLDARWQHWSLVNTSIHRDRRTGIYRLKQGEKLLDYLNSIMGIIEDHLGMDKGQHLIPSKFSSINQFAQFLQNFTQYLRDNYYLIETNFNKEQTDIIVADIANMVNEIIEMSNRCLEIILVDDNVPIPYQQVKKSLYNGDVKEFISLLNSIIKSVPYLIHKEKFNEGYFHSFFHVALTLIGMRPLSEVATSDGRIDMVINCPKTIYIMEFKYSANDKDLSKVALEQIKSKKYHQPYIIQQKPIVGIGYSFGEGTREITNYRDETLYIPGIILE